MTDNERGEGNYEVRFFKVVFGFAEHQEHATYGIRYKLTLPRISVCNVFSHQPWFGVDDAAGQSANEAVEG